MNRSDIRKNSGKIIFREKYLSLDHRKKRSKIYTNRKNKKKRDIFQKNDIDDKHIRSSE